jgi:predicted nucleic acid-binding Zn ribbon protein
MAENVLKAEGQCAHCGGALHTIDNPPTDNSIVTCQSCGEQIGTFKDVNDKIGKVLFDHAITKRNETMARLKRSFKRAGVKFR